MEDRIIKCPACIEGILEILSDQISVPHFGEVLISTMICSKCGYRTSDIIPLKKQSPKRHILKINHFKQMKLRVIRSGSSIVQIPEIGARIDPGLFSEGYVTNVEGVLQRFQNILYQLLRDLSSSMEEPLVDQKIDKTREIIERLDSFMNGKIQDNDTITLIIEDPYGNSAIIGEDEDRIIQENLTDQEIKEMLDLQNDRNDITDL